MARIAQTSRTSTELFKQLHAASSATGDNNDCAVKAISVVTGISYEDAQQRLAAKGRKKGERTYFGKTSEVIKDLGYKLERVDLDEKQRQYPKSKVGSYWFKSLTTHHFERFNEVWADGNIYLVQTSGHIAGVINGTIHDWTKGRSFRIITMYRVVKA
jgi:hypothetical protein